ncbi:MAG: DNA transposition protein [Desulfovibrio sp.]|nr:DNA transposition protein [Desulfovibrio sp.]MBI4960399.1 DNA transposition protein [Desulfovibrio sp.]
MPSAVRSSFIADLVPLVGQAVASELVRQLGGTTFPVPKRETAQGEIRYRMLVAVIGEAAADLLIYHYGGTELYIPRGARSIQEHRDAAINEEATAAIRAGVSTTVIVNELARKYQLTDRRVWDILKTLPKPETQKLSLF